ncbi:MAG: hypothetical protein IPQ07_16510 [Myxococcales bacterium]|nr:hypothetical protein [Myxococcales bacterium]
MVDAPNRIRQLVRRAVTLRREIVVLAVTILVADGLAATECLRMFGHPTVRMAFALGAALLVVIASVAFGRRLERELVLVRGEAARVLAAQLAE